MATIDQQFKEQGEKLDNLIAVISKLTHILEKHFTEQTPEPEPISEVKQTVSVIHGNDTNEYMDFKHKRLTAMFAGVILLGICTIAAFKWFLPAMSFIMAGFVLLLYVLFWLFIDKYIFYGHSLKKISNNPIAISLCVLGIAIVMSVGFIVGISYVSNPYGHEEPAPRRTTEQVQQPTQPESTTSTTPRNNSVVFPGGSGESER